MAENKNICFKYNDKKITIKGLSAGDVWVLTLLDGHCMLSKNTGKCIAGEDISVDVIFFNIEDVLPTDTQVIEDGFKVRLTVKEKGCKTLISKEFSSEGSGEVGCFRLYPQAVTLTGKNDERTIQILNTTVDDFNVGNLTGVNVSRDKKTITIKSTTDDEINGKVEVKQNNSDCSAYISVSQPKTTSQDPSINVNYVEGDCVKVYENESSVVTFGVTSVPKGFTVNLMTNASTTVNTINTTQGYVTVNVNNITGEGEVGIGKVINTTDTSKEADLKLCVSKRPLEGVYYYKLSANEIDADGQVIVTVTDSNDNDVTSDFKIVSTKAPSTVSGNIVYGNNSGGDSEKTYKITVNPTTIKTGVGVETSITATTQICHQSVNTSEYTTTVLAYKKGTSTYAQIKTKGGDKLKVKGFTGTGEEVCTDSNDYEEFPVSWRESSVRINKITREDDSNLNSNILNFEGKQKGTGSIIASYHGVTAKTDVTFTAETVADTYELHFDKDITKELNSPSELIAWVTKNGGSKKYTSEFTFSGVPGNLNGDVFVIPIENYGENTTAYTINISPEEEKLIKDTSTSVTFTATLFNETTRKGKEATTSALTASNASKTLTATVKVAKSEDYKENEIITELKEFKKIKWYVDGSYVDKSSGTSYTFIERKEVKDYTINAKYNDTVTSNNAIVHVVEFVPEEPVYDVAQVYFTVEGHDKSYTYNFYTSGGTWCPQVISYEILDDYETKKKIDWRSEISSGGEWITGSLNGNGALNDTERPDYKGTTGFTIEALTLPEDREAIVTFYQDKIYSVVDETVEITELEKEPIMVTIRQIHAIVETANTFIVNEHESNFNYPITVSTDDTVITLDVTSFITMSDGTTQEIEWEASSDSSWCHQDTKSVFIIDGNEAGTSSTDNRECKITVKQKDPDPNTLTGITNTPHNKQIIIAISQKGEELKVKFSVDGQENDFSFGANVSNTGQTYCPAITSEDNKENKYKWTAAVTQGSDWVTGSGSGTGSVWDTTGFTIAKNEETEERTGKITFTQKNTSDETIKTITVTFTQEALNLTSEYFFDDDVLVVGYEYKDPTTEKAKLYSYSQVGGGSKTAVAITGHTITSNPDNFITAVYIDDTSKTGGPGPYFEITVGVLENDDDKTREGTIDFTNANGDVITLTVQQRVNGEIVMTKFDYLVIDYVWSEYDGHDFDASVYFDTPELGTDLYHVPAYYLNKQVKKNSVVYLELAFDQMTTGGKETHAIYISRLFENGIMDDLKNSGAKNLVIQIYGNYFGSAAGDHHVNVSVQTYLGGEMRKDEENKLMVNVGSTEQQTIAAMTYQSAANSSTSGSMTNIEEGLLNHFGTITYDIKTKGAIFTPDSENLLE